MLPVTRLFSSSVYGRRRNAVSRRFTEVSNRCRCNVQSGMYYSRSSRCWREFVVVLICSLRYEGGREEKKEERKKTREEIIAPLETGIIRDGFRAKCPYHRCSVLFIGPVRTLGAERITRECRSNSHIFYRDEKNSRRSRR